MDEFGRGGFFLFFLGREQAGRKIVEEEHAKKTEYSGHKVRESTTPRKPLAE